jgi:hypothetical protein
MVEILTKGLHITHNVINTKALIFLLRRILDIMKITKTYWVTLAMVWGNGEKNNVS